MYNKRIQINIPFINVTKFKFLIEIMMHIIQF